ncbi:ROK family transcriptional regulator [Ruania alba]|uniref:Sugar kinase of the NBD/HSP70 family, may contain an N-terminal HTH domain n=1 Tax=Ruania alba TaxID=648782 RepID=A0A1H5GQG2_9MICO|nr:ROK family transcriptional regulator [Ruania alba]SEE17936.1 Sugar kinase of the NBD/HSP70 family, may contain an N-terminal HTH domain [Ruania alba]
MPSRTPTPSEDPAAPAAPGRRGTNLPRVADYNKMLVLDLIRRSAGISRVELVQHTGLTAQTMSNICRRLSDAGLIKESGRIYAGAGAPRTIFEVEPGGLYALGLHIDPAWLTSVVLNLAGEVVGTVRIPTPASPDPTSVLDAIEAMIRSLIADSGIPADRLAGLGVGTPGPIDVRTGAVVGAPYLVGWERVPLRTDLERRLDLPVTIDKDSTAVAVGEMWNAEDGPRNMAFVYIGTGIAAGLVLDGEVMRGSSGNIGHMNADPNGPICFCGGRGCLESTILPRNLVGEGTVRGVLPAVDIGDARALGAALTELCHLADSGQAEAVEIVERAARGLGRITGQLANLLDLDTIVFGGPQWEPFAPTILRIVPDVVTRMFIGRAVHPVTVRGTSIGNQVGAVGAASLAMWSSTFNAPTQLFLPH